MALLLQPLAETRLIVVEGVQGVVLTRLELRVDDRGRQGDLGGVKQGLEHLVSGLGALLHRFDPAKPRAKVGAQLVDGVEFAGELGELVVGRGQLALFHRWIFAVDLRLTPGIALRRPKRR